MSKETTNVTSINYVHRGERKSCKIADVCMFKSDNKYVEVHRNDGSVILTDLSLKALLSMTEQGLFTKVHRTYVVRTDSIKKVFKVGNSYGLHMIGIEDVVPVSRRLYSTVKTILSR